MDEQNNNKEQLLADEETGVEKLGKQAGKATEKVVVKLGKQLVLHILSVIGGIVGAALPILLACAIVVGIVVFISGLFNGNNEKNITDEKAYITTTPYGIMLSDENEIFESIKEQLYPQVDVSTLGLGKENKAKKYLYRFYRTALSTQLPYIEGADKLSNRYVQGMVHILRTSTTQEEAKQLKWMEYEDFKRELEKEEQSPNMLNYFTLDENWDLHIATYTEYIENGERKSYNLQDQKIPYQSLISAYTVPLEYIITMQQITRNPDYISKMCYMFVREKEIHFTIFDTVKTTTTTTTYKHSLMKKWVDTVTENVTDENGVPLVGTDGLPITTTNEVNQRTEEPEVQPDQVTVETLKENTIMCNVTYAKTWLTQVKKEYKTESLDTVYAYGEEGITDTIPDEAEPEGNTGEWKVNQSQNITAKEEAFEWIVEKEVGPIANAGEFIGLWRNKEGKYKFGAMGQTEKAGGKIVYYKKPYVSEEIEIEDQAQPSENKKEAPVTAIMQSQGILVRMLDNNSATQNYAIFMRQILKEYLEDRTYEPTDLNAPTFEESGFDTSIFETTEFTPIAGLEGTRRSIMGQFIY